MSRLRFNKKYRPMIKRLLFDIMFTEKSFSDLLREYKTINGKSFFRNDDDFDFKLNENEKARYEVDINDPTLDLIFEKFLKLLETRDYPTEKRKQKQHEMARKLGKDKGRLDARNKEK